MEVDHTKNEQDQRFSSVTTTLNRAPCLEDPSQFADWMRDHITPARNRKLHVEVLESTHDWQTYFSALNMSLTGLTTTHREAFANHVWRFVPRKMLGSITGATDVIECNHPDWEQLPPHMKDVCLLVKQSMHPTTFSQRPLLVLPYSEVQA